MIYSYHKSQKHVLKLNDYIYIYICGVSGGIVNILGGGSMDYCE